MATIRSREISACLVLQAQSQLKAIYKDNADTIIGNMDTSIFLGCLLYTSPDTRTGKIRALQESAALFSFLQANGIQSMQQLHEKIADMNTRYYDLRREIVKAERRIAVLAERGEMWAQYNEYKTVHKQLAKVKPEKRELFEQRHSRELILYDAAARYLKELKASGEEITPKEWQREIDLLTAQKQVDSLDMKAMREELKAVEQLRKAADQLARQERDKPRDRGPER